MKSNLKPRATRVKPGVAVCQCGDPNCTRTGPTHLGTEDYDLPNTNGIGMFMHCGMCLAEKPDDVSPAEWARLNVGWTKQGLQVWCQRHNVNVLHVDFEGIKHPANLTMPKRPPAA